MAVIVKTLYGTDFAEWPAQTAQPLRERRFDEIDIENVAEEIRSLGDSQGARSQLRRMLMHLITREIPPERDGASGRASIVNAHREILDATDLGDALPTIYLQAIRVAGREAGLDVQALSDRCPFKLQQLLDGDPTHLN